MGRKIDSTNELNSFFINSPSGIAVFKYDNRDDHITLVDLNPAAERIDKISIGEMQGKSVFEVFPETVQSGMLDKIKQAWDKEIKIYHTFEGIDRVTGECLIKESWIYKSPNRRIIIIYNDITKQIENVRKVEGYLSEIEKQKAAILKYFVHMEVRKEELLKCIDLDYDKLIKPLLVSFNKKSKDENINTDDLLRLFEYISTSNSYKHRMLKFNLTSAEFKIALLVKDGHRDKEISQMLNLSLSTVKNHKYAIRKKLNLANRKSTDLFKYLNNESWL